MTIDKSHERRKDVRVGFGTDVTVTFADRTNSYKGSSKDLSMRGVYVNTSGSEMPAEKTVCKVKIKLNGLEDDLVLNMEGHVLRVDSDGYAIYFDSVDLDSYTHLKNIVRYNTPDAD